MKNTRDLNRKQTGSSCFCFNARKPGKKLSRYRLGLMHTQSRRLIGSWFDKAVENQDASPEDSFEPFIYAWFAFNAWAACVTNEDSDSKYMQILIADEGLKGEFDKAMNVSSAFQEAAYLFAECWPIFSVKDLRKSNINPVASDKRSETVKHYLDGGAVGFQPQCWTEHQERNEACPCDWPHTIAAIYRMRCNLFHGEKTAICPIDQNIVQRAFRVLVQFMQRAELL